MRSYGINSLEGFSVVSRGLYVEQQSREPLKNPLKNLEPEYLEPCYTLRVLKGPLNN